MTYVLQWICYNRKLTAFHKFANFNVLVGKINADEKKNTLEYGVAVLSDQAANASKKRKTRFSDDGTEKRHKMGGLSDVGKNACMLLNEKCRDVVFKVSRVGPIHMPMFTIEATINGQVWFERSFVF